MSSGACGRIMSRGEFVAVSPGTLNAMLARMLAPVEL